MNKTELNYFLMSKELNLPNLIQLNLITVI